MTVDSGSIYLVEDGNQRTYENTDVGFTFTQPHLPGFMTAIEFLRFYGCQSGAHQTVAFSRRIFNVCRNFFRRAASFNERLFPWHENKVQMLLSLMVQPPIMLFDEPLTSFDVVAAHEIKQMIRSAKGFDHTVFHSYFTACTRFM